MPKLLDKLTNQAKQQYTLIGVNGEKIAFNLNFMPTQSAWQFDTIYQNFQLNGVFLTVSPGLLYNFRNILPFDLMCTSTDGYEPQFINDFVVGRISLYLLSQAEGATVDAQILA